MLAHGIKAIREHLAGLPDQEGMEITARRKMYDAAERIFKLPEGMSVSKVECGGRPAELLEPAGGAERALLYLHGGGYVIGSAQSHRHLAAAIAEAAGAAAPWRPITGWRRKTPFPPPWTMPLPPTTGCRPTAGGRSRSPSPGIPPAAA